MTCIRPQTFDKAQIEKCQACRHASRKKVWCCLHGIAIIEAGRVITPKPQQIITGPPSMEQMQADYKLAHTGMSQRGKRTVTWAEYLRRRLVCMQCAGGYKCPHVCCGIQARLASPEWTCKEGKW